MSQRQIERLERKRKLAAPGKFLAGYESDTDAAEHTRHDEAGR